MAEVVWIFDRLFLPRRLDFEQIAVVPLLVNLDTMGAALGAYGTEAGAPWELDHSQVPAVDMAAVVFRGVNGDDPDEALITTRSMARAIASALGFRQMGRGRLVGAVAWANDSVVIRSARCISAGHEPTLRARRT